MDASEPSKSKAKGINLLDSFAVKRQLDEVATEVRSSPLKSGLRDPG